MAKMEKALEKLLRLEFNSPANALHWNAGEKGYTYMGIYEYAHPKWEGWTLVKRLVGNGVSLAKNSSVLYYNQELTEMVGRFYKKMFWDKMRLDEVKYQNMAEELFVFGVNVGVRAAVKTAQIILNVKVDGHIGPNTLKALNEFDNNKFDKEYDKAEIAYYEKLITKNPSFKKNLNGWRNRANTI